MPGIYTLTTDFGPGEYVGAMKGVLLSLDPEATIVDLDNSVRPQDIRHGAYVLLTATPHFPFAVHIGVVDPGVGTQRRSVVLVCEGAFLVGPDNGLLVPAARHLGLKEARAITNRKLLAKEVSSTFHGRDVFAPVAAHLMTGTKVKDVGPVIKDFVELDFGEPKATTKGLEGLVITSDRFGNIITNLPRNVVEKRWRVGGRIHLSLGGYEADLPLVATYGEVERGDFLATFSSGGFLEVARREGSAAFQLHISPGLPVTAKDA
ncbi:MAG TPA: SAM-dependent chlorinase/fluorinase [Thermoplasmata archaeon]|nr:SAM-dependent chlorinase/fluorinase [Thermoplasmata archaeon]